MWSSSQIKNVRLKVMLSKQEFASALNVGLNTVNRWENGEFSPNYKAQRKLTAFCIENKIFIDANS